MFVPNITRNIKPVEAKPVEAKPVEAKPVEAKPVEAKPVGIKHDEGKARFDLITPEFEEQLAKVLTIGAKKYAVGSWHDVPDATNRYYAALHRHLNAWRKGEKIDAESQLSHLAHAAANVMFLLELDKE